MLGRDSVPQRDVRVGKTSETLVKLLAHNNIIIENKHTYNMYKIIYIYIIYTPEPGTRPVIINLTEPPGIQ